MTHVSIFTHYHDTTAKVASGGNSHWVDIKQDGRNTVTIHVQTAQQAEALAKVLNSCFQLEVVAA